MKEKQEFQDAIVADLALLGITPDKTTHTSDCMLQDGRQASVIIATG